MSICGGWNHSVGGFTNSNFFIGIDCVLSSFLLRVHFQINLEAVVCSPPPVSSEIVESFERKYFILFFVINNNETIISLFYAGPKKNLYAWVLIPRIDISFRPQSNVFIKKYSFVVSF